MARKKKKLRTKKQKATMQEIMKLLNAGFIEIHFTT